jgi:aerobic carbon-monoxide dehydrogenase large subunit
MDKADWKGFAARKAQSEKAGKWRGIGMATYVEKCSGGGPETVKAVFNDDATISLFTGNQTNGQGHETALRQIASAKFGVDVERIRLVQGDSDVVPDGFTGGSRTIALNGVATIGVADKIIAKGKQHAANILEASAADIDYKDGAFMIVGTDRKVDLFDVAKANKGKLDDEFTRTPEADTFPNGCHICELEVDPDTATVEIRNYTVMDDFGMALNPLLLQGQVHGGIGQGVGQALSEHAVYDKDSGQLLSGSFMDYAFPRADIVPSVSFDLHNSPCKTNPLGVKGAGEAGAIGAPPAVINAIVSAIYPHTGVKHVDMPVTPAALWDAISTSRRKKAA